MDVWLLSLSPMVSQIVWAETCAGGGCWRSGSGPQWSRFGRPNWCIKACLLGSPPCSQQSAKAYMDGGGDAVALHLLWAAGTTSCFTSRKLWEPAKAASVWPPPVLLTASPFHQWPVPAVANTAAGESSRLPHCSVSHSCEWKLH